MNLFLFNPASRVTTSCNQNTASLLFTAKKKKKKKAEDPQPQTTSQRSSGVTTPTGVSNSTSATAALGLSQAVEDSFQKTLPSLAPIHSFLEGVEASSDFQAADGPMKQQAEALLQTAKAMTQDPKISHKERLTALNNYAVQLFDKNVSWQDLMQFLKIMNVPVLESNQHAWVQPILDKQAATALFVHPPTLYGFAPDWQPSTHFLTSSGLPKSAASAASIELFPGSKELSEKLAKDEKPLKEDSVRILATTKPAQGLMASHGENVSLNFLKHETYHFLQLIMGIPLHGPSIEAYYRAMQVRSGFMRSLRSEQKRIDETAKLMHEAFGNIQELRERYEKVNTELASLLETGNKINASLANSTTSRLKLKTLERLKTEILELDAERSELLEKMTATKKGKTYKEVFIDQKTLSIEANIRRATLIRKALLEKKKAKKEDSPMDMSVGAAMRRKVNREQEVYNAMINNKDAMGIDPKFHLYNLEAWFTQEQLERESHKYDNETYKV